MWCAYVSSHVVCLCVKSRGVRTAVCVKIYTSNRRRTARVLNEPARKKSLFIENAVLWYAYVSMCILTASDRHRTA